MANVGPATGTTNMHLRRNSASPRESKDDWTKFSTMDPERRGSGIPMTPVRAHNRSGSRSGTEHAGEPLLAGTPSHDHADPLNSWNSARQGQTGNYSFPRTDREGRSPLSALFHSRLFRNVMAIAGTLILVITIVSHQSPQTLEGGLNYLSYLPGLGRLGREEMKSLDQRLRDLMTRPVLEQWEMESVNRYQCPMYTFSRMTYFFHEGKQHEWESVTKEEIRRYRNKMISHLKEVEESGDALVWTPGVGGGGHLGRGIILTGAGGPRLEIILRMLRTTLKCDLPVEIYHFPDEMHDQVEREKMEVFGGVRLVELGSKNANGKNWHIKNAAFIQSEFTEFVYMDSDNIPLVNPEELFESVEYKQSGSVFWPDLNKDHPDNAIWRILGRPCSDEHWPGEAGQIVFDKRGNNGLNLAALHLANHMMTNPDMYGFLSYGDKDTFRFSFYALGLKYQQSSKMFASTGGFQTENGDPSPDYFCGHSMIQWGLTPYAKRNDPTFHPRPAFLHTILAKHRSNLDPAKLWSHYRRPRLDDIDEPTLTRTLYEWTGDCFAIQLKGPDGLPTSANSFRDGQGVLTEKMDTAFGPLGEEDEVYKALMEIAPTFVSIAH